VSAPAPLRRRGLLERIVARFLGSRNAAILLLASLGLGTAAILVTAREEDPQIVVPLADVYIKAPGSSAEEVERLVSTPLERLLWQVDGVEYVYSVSMRGRAVVTVRFYVNEDREDSLIKLRDRIQSHRDIIPSIVTSWVVKPVEIDDVPILLLTLSGKDQDGYAIRRIGEELKARLDALPELSRTQLVGGLRREIRVDVDRDRLHARNLTLADVADAIRQADVPSTAGSFDRLDTTFHLTTGGGFHNAAELGALVVASRGRLPVRLREIADITDGPEEPGVYTRIAFGPADKARTGETRPAVTLALSKQKGTDAWSVAQRVLKEVGRIREQVLPQGIDVTVTRNYGETANRKVNELFESIVFALASVAGLLFLTLGWREALTVTLSIPMSFALALFVNWALGYTINRVTLFALILSLGLVVDDPITNVDNIQRHLRKRAGPARDAVLDAVREVLPPVIMSTLTIIVSFLPMLFITGMMGPYMRPMAANVPLTVSFSTVAALSVVPWLAHLLLKHKGLPDGAGGGEPPEAVDPTSPLARRFYRRLLAPFVASRRRAWLLLGFVLALFLGANGIAALGLVPLKMLPYDNKDELQVMLDLPEGATLEHTDAVVRDFENYLVTQPEITSVQSFVGTASPMDFNGMIRHTYLRQSPELADIHINLVPREERSLQSHAIGLRMRHTLEDLAARDGVRMKLVEVPPGPPVLSTVVAEVYGREETPYAKLVAAARSLEKRMAAEKGLTDLDVMATEPHARVDYSLDRQQAGLHGVREAQVARLLGLAISGGTPGTVRTPGERQPLPIRVRLPRPQRTGSDQLGLLAARSTQGALIPLAEIGSFTEKPADAAIYHKDLLPVVYVLGEMAGRPPAEAILSLKRSLRKDPLPDGIRAVWDGEGEWHITLRVFRDLGFAFAAAMVLIYILLMVETNSMAMPLLVMLAIPLVSIGIMPGFFFLNRFFAPNVGGFPDSIFFTATAMIGMIALGGIVVRNSLVLIEFIRQALEEGMPFQQALFESGAVRMRPILLTAGTTALGAWPIALDPIFSGLAWALIFGLVASTLFTLVVVPSAYYLLNEKKHRRS